MKITKIFYMISTIFLFLSTVMVFIAFILVFAGKITPVELISLMLTPVLWCILIKFFEELLDLDERLKKIEMQLKKHISQKDE